MKTWGPVLLAAIVGAAALASPRSEVRPAPWPSQTSPGRVDPSSPASSSGDPTAETPRPLPDCPRELGARLRSERGFEEYLFGEFMTTMDATRMSFLQNVLAEDPRRRNSPAWQCRFAMAAESDPRAERRKAALLFLQQSESISTVRESLFRMAKQGMDRKHALAALNGLPRRRLKDAGLQELASVLSNSDPDPDIRHVAGRILASFGPVGHPRPR